MFGLRRPRSRFRVGAGLSIKASPPQETASQRKDRHDRDQDPHERSGRARIRHLKSKRHNNLHSSLEIEPRYSASTCRGFSKVKSADLKNSGGVLLRGARVTDDHFIASKLAFLRQFPLDPPQQRVKPKDANQRVYKCPSEIIPALRVRQFVQ